MDTFKWQQVDTVLLDMDGTLLDLNFDNYFWLTYVPQVYAKKNQLDEATANTILTKKFAAAEGTLNWYSLDYWSEVLDLDIIAMKYETSDRVAFRPQTVEFLEYINHLNKQVVLVTNAHPKTLEIKLLKQDFNQYFTELLTSHQFAAPKEDSKFWPRLAQHLTFDKKRTLFIDDSLRVLQAAAAYGIGFNLAIAQPDSQLPKQHFDDFTMLNEFYEIMP